MTPAHTTAFRTRRVLNWFPLGLAYAMLYMGRYNLTVAKNALGELMTKEDFGIIFGAGTIVYAFAFLVNGPLVDRIGGRRGMLLALGGAGLSNLAMGAYLATVVGTADAQSAPLRLVFSLLYAVNMYFQSFGAVSIVKVNAHWFHVSERGGFSGIFGTMISSGIFLAFTVNGWLLDVARRTWPDTQTQYVVFFAPAALLGILFVVELMFLRDRPGLAGHADFDTGDASSGEGDAPIPALQLFRRMLTNPVILTVAAIEFCTGVLRNGVMHWFPIYAKEVWVLEPQHLLMYGTGVVLLDNPDKTTSLNWVTLASFAVAAVTFLIARRAGGNRRGGLIVLGALAFLAPFFQGGWGGLLFVAGVMGGNIAGWVSDLLFQSRRGPAAFFLYAILTFCVVGMAFSLSPAQNVVAWAHDASGLKVGDRIVAVNGTATDGWDDVGVAVACVPAVCKDSGWDTETCSCRSKLAGGAVSEPKPTFTVKLVRDGVEQELELKDPAPAQRAGDKRTLKARPALPISPWFLGVLVFLMSLCVIGTHGLLSGTATMDFGGRRAAATAVGVIDGFVYAGTALQSVALGFLTTKDWAYWPWFLLPFAIAGTFLLTRIWNAKPKGRGGH